MQSKTENLRFSFIEMRNIIQSDSLPFPCQLFQIRPAEQPVAFMQYLFSLKNAKTPTRNFCLIDYQDHWIAVDIEKKSDSFSIILLDAANVPQKVGGFCFLLEQICAQIKLSFELIHISTLDSPLQRDGYSCPIFSWTLLHWASQQIALHSQLKEVVLPTKENQAHIDCLKKLVVKFISNQDLLLQIFQSMDKMKIVDYSSLMDLENMSGFFMSSHSLNMIPGYIEESVKKWLIEATHPKTGEYVLHNIKSLYDEHQMKVLLREEASLTENEFIVREIAMQYKETTETLGRLFRKTIAASRPYHVRALLLTGAVEVNEVPPSGQTALDRAESLPEVTDGQRQKKQMILGFLREKGAISGQHLNLTVTATPTATEDNQECLKKQDVQSAVTT